MAFLAHFDAGTLAAPLPEGTTTRPPTGIGRGLWEAPVWAFYAAALVVVLFASLYTARRAGLLRSRPK